MEQELKTVGPPHALPTPRSDGKTFPDREIMRLLRSVPTFKMTKVIRFENQQIKKALLITGGLDISWWVSTKTLI